jgi:arsenate reductase
MSTLKIYHNPRCSKSRKTLEIIQQKGLVPEIIKYLETAPTIKEIELVLTKLNLEPRQIMRKNETEYKQYFTDELLTNKQLVELMHKYPKVIERPIVLNKNKAVIGRPPEAVLEIL